jgi:hypothetical protein
MATPRAAGAATKAHSWSRSPPWPSGLPGRAFAAAMNPSSDMLMSKTTLDHRTSDSWISPLQPMQEGVTRISRTAEIEVRVPAQTAFDIIAAEIRPIDDGPLRVGFRWQQTMVHERSVCRSDWIVTELREPYVLEQTMGHLCIARRREVMGGERWQFEETPDGVTVVSLRAWHSWPGMWGRLGRLLAHRHGGAGFSLRERLAYVRFRAERGLPRPA